jgi:2,3-bisphosphoglycerate-independent phosphoglycerate mutase
MKKPTVLCILDGWGESVQVEHNAIAQAHTPHWNALRAAYPFSTLSASEGDVGLPQGQMGNSEVGHMNIGAGRVVMQDLPRIDAAIADGSLAKNAELKNYIAALQKTGGTCHLLGLLSDGGVHSHVNHMTALANIIADTGVPVAVHAILDGRDTAPQSAEKYIAQFREHIGNRSSIYFATIMGRYYAMDRDKRWDRVSEACYAMVDADASWAETAEEALKNGYELRQQTDEFITPQIIGNYEGIFDGDGLLMANFRADRARQILTALLDPAFDKFPRARMVKFAASLGMVEYSEALNPLIPAIFTKASLRNNMGELLSTAGRTQLRIAETEKYAHVTFFFSGGREEPYAGEQRILVPSPQVATYDLQPEMSAFEMTDKLVAAIDSDAFDFIVVNYANTDMVGHSGDLQAAMKAVEAVDSCLGKLSATVLKNGGTLLITADHGNAECLHDDDGDQPHTAHTLNPVPCLLVSADYEGKKTVLRNGVLADIAPTLCAIMGITQPPEMTGTSLLTSVEATHAMV